MRRRVWGALGLALLAGCGEGPGAATVASGSAVASASGSTAPPVAPAAAVVKNRSGSAIAMSMGAEALYVASEDHRALFQVALPLTSTSRVDRLAMPGAPAQIVALTDRVLVTVRDPGLLLELAPGPGGVLVEKRRVELAADAWGMAVSPDGKVAVVTSAWTHTVSGVDLEAMRVLWTKDVAREPRGVVVQPDGERAYVSHLVGSALTRIDEIGAKEPSVKQVALAPAPARTPAGKKLSAALGYTLVTDPEGTRLFAPRHALGALGGWFSSSSWWGATTVDVLRTVDDAPIALAKNGGDAVQRINAAGDTKTVTYFEYTPDISMDARHAPMPTASWDPVTQPRAAVYRTRTRTLLVAGEGDNLVAELDARAIEPALHALQRYAVSTSVEKPLQMVKTGGAPSAIVLDELEENAYVFGRSTYDVTLVKLAADPHSRRVDDSAGAVVSLAEDPLLEDVADAKKRKVREVASWGRRFFYASNDGAMSRGMACAGCHPEGRDDGYVWYQYAQKDYRGDKQEYLEAGIQAREALTGLSGPQDPIGPGVARQTPMLAGRVMAVGPYGWLGESENLEARVELGFKLHHGYGEGRQRALAVANFVRFGLTTPPKVSRPLTQQEERGRAVFMSNEVGCTSCHDPATSFTDRKPISVKVTPVAGYGSEDDAKFKTPSLLWVSGSPPYFHNGGVKTLRDLVMGNGDRMGKTDHLSGADKEALIAFLETL
jgi:DNA-binding beta-propeller fold protein YncE